MFSCSLLCAFFSDASLISVNPARSRLLLCSYRVIMPEIRYPLHTLDTVNSGIFSSLFPKLNVPLVLHQIPFHFQVLLILPVQPCSLETPIRINYLSINKRFANLLINRTCCSWYYGNL